MSSRVGDPLSIGRAPTSPYRGLVRMYVEDERFRATYDAAGPGTAEFLARACSQTVR